MLLVCSATLLLILLPLCLLCYVVGSLLRLRTKIKLFFTKFLSFIYNFSLLYKLCIQEFQFQIQQVKS